MKYIILASLLSSAAFAAPAPFANQGQGQGQRGGQGQGGQGKGAAAGNAASAQGANGAAAGAANAPQAGAGAASAATPGANGTPSAADLATAVSNWMADTSMVSNFLNTGKSIQNNVQFKQAATVAFNAEVDELTHKAIIDSANSQMPNVIAANSTLATGGAFQDVVDKLKLMSVQGKAAVANIDLINQNRCVNVLPNIDAYMASTGSSSQAVRPTVCDQTGVAGGVQGQGPTLPGQAPGTPQAAFDAAAALAKGTGNGQVQNTGTPAATGGAANAGTANAGAQGAGAANGAQGAGAAAGAQGQGAAAGAQGAGAANGAQGAGAAAGAQSQGAAKGAQGAGAQGAGAANGAQGAGAAKAAKAGKGKGNN